MSQRTTFHTQTPLQALILEQALLLARQLEQTAAAAPDGQVLAKVEALAVGAARELARQAVQATLQAQAAEKKGRRAAAARAATSSPGARGAARNVLTAAGDVRVTRLDLVCRRCSASRYPLDERLGLEGFVSPQAKKLLTLAGASWSFAGAARHLAEFCGLRTCDQTVRKVCHEEAGLMADWLHADPGVGAGFAQASGD